jgi:hypothetical protein
VRTLFEGGELAEPELVENLSRFLIAEVVRDSTLKQGQRDQARRGELGAKR